MDEDSPRPVLVRWIVSDPFDGAGGFAPVIRFPYHSSIRQLPDGDFGVITFMRSARRHLNYHILGGGPPATPFKARLLRYHTHPS